MPVPPPWSREETLLALSLATVRAQHVPIDDPEILQLSDLLRSAAPTSAATCAKFRNPHGVARKIWRFVDRLAEGCERALSPVEESAWREFSSDPQGLAAEVERIRCRLADQCGYNELPSRGPSPAMSESIRTDQGPAWLYLAALDGVVTDLNEIFVKVGRSNNISRRESDLNFPLPRRLGLRWLMIATWRLPDPAAAHLAEQTILRSEASAGRSAGGEFLLMPIEAVGQLLRRCGQISRRSSNAGPVRRKDRTCRQSDPRSADASSSPPRCG